MFLTVFPRWVTRLLPDSLFAGSLTEQREQASLARDAHAVHPRGGVVELLRPGQSIGPVPGTVEGSDAVGADHLVGEALAPPVLRELHLEAEHLGDHRVEQAAAVAVAVERPAQVRVAWIELVSDRVHDVLRVAL